MSGILHGLIGSLVAASSEPIEYLGYVIVEDTGGNWSASLTSLGLQEGDMVVAGTAADGGTVTVTTDGYTQVESGSENNPSYSMYYKIMGSTPDSIIQGNNSGSGAAYTSAVVSAFRNAGSIGELATADGASGDPNPPSITTTVNGCMIVAYGFIDDDRVETFTVPSGFTTIGAAQSNQFSNGSSTLAAYYLQETAGTIDPTTMSNDGSDKWYAMTIALRPA